MRLLANENFPGDAVADLIAKGHDVVWVRTASPGMADADIINWARQQSRIVITFDKDFGELAWRDGLGAGCGVVLFRIPMPSASSVGRDLAARLAERSDLEGHFSVIEPGRVRMRAMPESRSGE